MKILSLSGQAKCFLPLLDHRARDGNEFVERISRTKIYQNVNLYRINANSASLLLISRTNLKFCSSNIIVWLNIQ